ncbi:MAG: alanine--glyoxylate aminotransferase family protein, partial [Cyclobacteriaceae bacterium]|nr:alanine--glyoxylate aminotransferase family protein [Cyclobacteriaceae bacterium]
MSYTFNPPSRILMGPGPSDAHPRVLKAMSSPLIGHLDPEFVRMMDEVKDMVQQTFMTKNML